MAGDAPIIAGHQATGKEQDDARGNHNQAQGRAARRHFFAFAPKPEEYGARDGKAEKDTLVRAAVEKDRDAHTEQDSHGRRRTPFHSPERPEDKRSSNRSHRAAPITVHPVGSHAQPERGEDSREKGPPCGHPRLQHPDKSRGHRRGAEQHANPRIAEQLAERQRKSLCGRIF